MESGSIRVGGVAQGGSRTCRSCQPAEILEPDFSEDITELVELLHREATLRTDPPDAECLTEDPDDEYLAALAEEAAVDYLVTGNHSLQRWRSDAVKVVSPREFLEQLGD
jgi:predicted nucleic acid-binding protein